MEREEDELPSGFRTASKIAMHCCWGTVALFLAFKIPFINSGIRKDVLDMVNMILLIVGIPSIILAGPGIIKLIKIVKNGK